MLSNLSSANNPVNENSVIQKAQNDYAEIDQRVDDLETEVAENTAALNQQGAQITSLANQVADVAAKTTFPTLNTDRINSAGAGSVTVGSSLNVTGNVNASNATISGYLKVGGTNFNTVRDNASTAAANASTALTKANQAITKANATETALNEYKDQIANSVSTGTANISGGLTVGETINANDVVSNEGHFGSIETPSIDVKEIKSAGSLELPAQMSTPNDWFTITVPNGITATFSGSYQGKKYKFTVDKGNIEYDQDVLELIKDVSFKRSDNNVRIRVKADEALTYSFTDTGAVEPISIQKSTEAYADYSYAPQKARGTIYKGFDDRTSEIQMPGIFCASVIRADEQEYVRSAAECQIISKKLFLPDDWDETGMISCTSGTDNQYVSNATKDGCVSPTWKTPVETAVDGKLSNTHCLITEKAVSEYNGTVDDGTDVTYPITNIGDDACVHGKLTAECLCGTCCVQGKAACFQEDVQADCFNGNCLIVCDIYGKAPVGGTSKVIVHDDTEFMNTTTFDENSCFKKKIVVDCDADFGEDVHIAGDLYVNGVSHVVDEETIETPSNEIMLRQNATTGLANTEISGILINKYNGTDSLTVGTDNTGTLRVGTGTGTSTSYATICHNQTENKWYVNDAEVTPVGVLQSYATKTVEDPYTVYTDAVFIAIDKTSLEPVLTRDEEADMTQCGITYWDATNTKAKTASKIKYNNNGLDFDGKTCIEAAQTTITDGTNTTTIDATKVKSKCGCFTDACVERTITSDITCACTCVEAPLICASTCLAAGNGTIENNLLICGSLTVCGETAITGLMSDCVATTQLCCNDTFYLPFVHCNHITQGANVVCTNSAIRVYPSSTCPNISIGDTTCATTIYNDSVVLSTDQYNEKACLYRKGLYIGSSCQEPIDGFSYFRVYKDPNNCRYYTENRILSSNGNMSVYCNYLNGNSFEFLCRDGTTQNVYFSMRSCVCSNNVSPHQCMIFSASGCNCQTGNPSLYMDFCFLSNNTSPSNPRSLCWGMHAFDGAFDTKKISIQSSPSLSDIIVAGGTSGNSGSQVLARYCDAGPVFFGNSCGSVVLGAGSCGVCYSCAICANTVNLVSPTCAIIFTNASNPNSRNSYVFENQPLCPSISMYYRTSGTLSKALTVGTANDGRLYMSNSSYVTCGHSTIIGIDAGADGSYTTALGYGACADGPLSVAVGALAQSEWGSVAIGYCACSDLYAIAIGCCVSTTRYSISIGDEATTSCCNSIAIGTKAIAKDGCGALAIGYCAQSGFCCCVYYSSHITMDDPVYGRHGCVDIIIPPGIEIYRDKNNVPQGCACIGLKCIWKDVINAGRCEVSGVSISTFGRCCFEYTWCDNKPILKAKIIDASWYCDGFIIRYGYNPILRLNYRGVDNSVASPRMNIWCCGAWRWGYAIDGTACAFTDEAPARLGGTNGCLLKSLCCIYDDGSYDQLSCYTVPVITPYDCEYPTVLSPGVYGRTHWCDNSVVNIICGTACCYYLGLTMTLEF